MKRLRQWPRHSRQPRQAVLSSSPKRVGIWQQLVQQQSIAHQGCEKQNQTAHCWVHPAGEGSEEASSGGAGGDALGLGYGSDGEDADEESPSAAVKQEGSDTGKQEELQNPVAAVKLEEKSEGGDQGNATEKGEAAPVKEEPLAAETGKAVAPEATAEAAAVKEDDADKPPTVGSQPSMPSTKPAEVQSAATSREDMAVEQPLGDTATPASAEARGEPAHVSGLRGDVVPEPVPATNSSEAGEEPPKPAFSKGDKCARPHPSRLLSVHMFLGAGLTTCYS